MRAGDARPRDRQFTSVAAASPIYRSYGKWHDIRDGSFQRERSWSPRSAALSSPPHHSTKTIKHSQAQPPAANSSRSYCALRHRSQGSGSRIGRDRHETEDYPPFMIPRVAPALAISRLRLRRSVARRMGVSECMSRAAGVASPDRGRRRRSGPARRLSDFGQGSRSGLRIDSPLPGAPKRLGLRRRSGFLNRVRKFDSCRGHRVLLDRVTDRPGYGAAVIRHVARIRRRSFPSNFGVLAAALVSNAGSSRNSSLVRRDAGPPDHGSHINDPDVAR